MRYTADAVCQQIGFCANQTCNLFPKPKTARVVPIGIKIEVPDNIKMPSFEWPWELVADHLPAVDDDKDKVFTQRLALIAEIQ